ncbi:MAG TPA: hypothetical protein PLQ74_07195 [Pseudomonadota bacterium]|nr:hypothetical protein [Xanthomonadales bacterium]HQW81637.1 hypothetical protein [Pseudomonadota bacterium]
MTCRIALMITALLGGLVGADARADVFAGKTCEPGCNLYRAMTIFGDAMTGDTAPLSLLGGPNQSGMLDATDLTYDAGERTLIVSDFYGQKIHIFSRDSRGDVAPLRSFSNVFLGQPRNVAVAAAQNEYIVIDANFIFAFPRGASGAATALRMTSYDPALVQNLNGLAYRSSSDEIFVGDYYDIGGGQYAGEILIFPRTIAGAPVTTRRIAGPATQMGSWIADIHYNPSTDELYVLTGANDGSGSVLTFAAGANGDVAPIRRIAGAATGMVNAAGLGFDDNSNELLVASGSFNAAPPHILGFPRTATGNVAPSRNISGPNTGVNGTSGWYDVVSVPMQNLFANGFEQL